MHAFQCCARFACVAACVAISICVVFFLKRARAHEYLSNIEVRTLCRYDLRSSVFAIVVCSARVVLIIGFAFFVSFEGCRFMYQNQIEYFVLLSL
jgi:hypothetical protein